MTPLLESNPFGPRDDARLLADLNELTSHHIRGCKPYAALFGSRPSASALTDVPYLHVGVFKNLVWKTEAPGIKHQRTLSSSATTGARSSQILLDEKSSELQGRSTTAIHRAWFGEASRPLLVLDAAKSLQQPGRLSARLAAGMSLRGLSTAVHFLLEDADNPASVRWSLIDELLTVSDDWFVYGSTFVLWQAWAQANMKAERLRRLRERTIDFVHSGGWKKLETMRVDPSTFNSALLKTAGPNSRVTDYYGLAEQVGVLFPLCSENRRHAPVWSEVIVCDPFTLEPLENEPGLLQFLNPLAFGAPYHSVLTEDLGIRKKDSCRCGRVGRTFELLGRVPRSEARGCGNV